MNISQEEVEIYINEVKQSVNAGRYQISNRNKNQKLFIDYVLSEDKCKEIILSLSTQDFSVAVNNDHPDHPEEILYILGKDVKLIPRFGGDLKIVALYIKFNKLPHKYVVVISFHEQDHPLVYPFKSGI